MTDKSEEYTITREDGEFLKIKYVPEVEEFHFPFLTAANFFSSHKPHLNYSMSIIKRYMDEVAAAKPEFAYIIVIAGVVDQVCEDADTAIDEVMDWDDAKIVKVPWNHQNKEIDRINSEGDFE